MTQHPSTHGGGPIARQGAIASACGRFILAPAGSEVRCYAAPSADGGGSAPGGTAALALVLRGHADTVTAVCRDPQNDEQVYTASLDGTLRTWHLPSASCVDSLDVGAPVTAAVIPPPPPGAGSGGAAFLSTTWGGGGGNAPTGRLIRVNLASRSIDPARFKLRGPVPLALAAGGSAVVAWERRTLWVWPAAPGGRLHAPITLHHTKAFSAAAAGGPADDVLAAGDVTGRILVWRGLAGAVTAALRAAVSGSGGGAPGPASSGNNGSSAPPAAPRSRPGRDGPLPPPATLHWHASAVTALAFSPDGAWLLSGGGEGVLVGWAAAGGGRAYLPRLGGALASIAAVPPSAGDGVAFIVAQADNSLRRVSWGAPPAVEWSVHGLRPALPAGAGLPAGGAAWRPGTAHLAVAGANAAIQFFDTARDAHAARLQASPRNPVAAAPLPGGGPPPPDPRVTGLAFSAAGDGMATAEAAPRSGAPCGVACSLKLWAAPPASLAGGPPFVLEAEVRDPHRGPVAALAYSPASHAVASAGTDGELKVWVRRGGAGPRRGARAAAGAPAAPPPAGPGQWRCAWVASYRGLPMRTVAFAGDGSAVAAGAGGRAVVWGVATGDRLAVLPGPPSAAGAGLRALAFVPGTPFLVGAYGGVSPTVCAWNLLDGRLAWAAAADVRRVAAAPAGGAVALALAPPPPPPPPAAPAASPSAGGRVVLLDAASGPASPPLAAWDVARGPVDALLWTDDGGGRGGRWLILTADREFALLGGRGGAAEGGGLTTPAPVAAPAAVAGFAAAFGGADGGAGAAAADAAAAAGTAAVTAAAGKAAKQAEWSDLFDAPSHALPAPSALAPAFFEALCGGREG